MYHTRYSPYLVLAWPVLLTCYVKCFDLVNPVKNNYIVSPFHAPKPGEHETTVLIICCCLLHSLVIRSPITPHQHVDVVFPSVVPVALQSCELCCYLYS